MKSNKFLFGALFLACLGTAGETQAQKTLAGNRVRVDNMAVARNGKNLVVNMDLVLDSLQMRSNRAIVFTPLVQSADASNNKLFKSVMVNGRKQQIMYERGNRRKAYPDAMAVQRINGRAQSVHYVSSVPYQPWMNGSNIKIAEDLCGCGNILEQNQSQMTTFANKLPQLTFACVKPLEEINKVREKVGQAYLDFPVDKTTIYPNYRRNPQELGKIIETINTVKNDEDVKIKEINIHGFASPESPYRHNTMLADGRAKALKNYVKKLYEFDDKLFTSVTSTPENWEGLRSYVAGSSISNRDAILSIIDSNREPDAKEAFLKKSYPAEYRQLLRDCYPGLRRSDYVVKYNVRNFDLNDARKVYRNDPDKLSVAEMYAVADSYGMNSSEAKDVIATAVRLHPDDATANLNAGIMELNNKNLDKADGYLKKAGDTPAALNACGVLKAQQGDYQSAKNLFQRASEAGFTDAESNLKLLNDYINN
jgi:outer membrane protein OmpA-like peptidoglycan-associated protein